MNEPNYFRISVKGIVVDEAGRFLLAREDSGMWDMLGGGLEHSEDPIEGLRREVYEEAGLVITWVSPTPKYFLTSIRFGHDTYVANIVYEIALEHLEFKPSEECKELRFFTLEEARNQKLFPTVEKLLVSFDRGLHM
ncbi:MAG TPA: NUDIX hydrolase [Candidatus Saccharimonadales bacterium]|nr:NUDIX hydrolase [Candidatus Saccharimonadales bacterium]